MSLQLALDQGVVRQQAAEANVTSSLFQRTMSAFAWRFISESSKFGLQLSVMMVLGRLLPVESFGLLTLCMVVINFASKAQIGVASALVQRSEISEKDIRVAFSLSVVSGTILTTTIWYGSPEIASLFRAPELTLVLRLISISFLFTSFGAIAEALLERRLDYRSLLQVELCSYGIGFCGVSIVLALLHYGVWSLAWGTIAYSFFRNTLLFCRTPHPVMPLLLRSEVRAFLNFGSGTTLSRLANWAAANADYFVVGRWLGTAALGLYSRAFQLMSLPMYQFASVLSYVLFPAYSRIQKDNVRLRHAYFGSVFFCSLGTLPILASIVIVAPDLMTGFFGSQWSSAARPLQVLCVGGIFQCMYNLSDSLSRAKGAVYWKFSCHVIYAICVFVGALLGRGWGITGVAVGVVVGMAVIYLLMAKLSITLIRGTWLEFFRAQAPGAMLAIAAAGIAWPTVVLARWAELPHVPIVVIGLLVSSTAAVITFGLLPESWLDNASGGASQKLKTHIRSTTASFDPVQRIKFFLREHRIVFLLALIPYRAYENVLYLGVLIREGLWKQVIPWRGSSVRRPRQAYMKWNVLFPQCRNPQQLLAWFKEQGIEVREGGHTLYIPPQEKLQDVIPSIASFYPANSGFKILKDFRGPASARYFYKHRRSLIVLGRMIGTIQDQIDTANFLSLAGVGPRLIDLTYWQSPTQHFTVFVVQDVGQTCPARDDYNSAIDRLKRLHCESDLRVLLPDWEQNEDFQPPHCNGNLIYSQALGHSLYVDFQNFRVKHARGPWHVNGDSTNQFQTEPSVWRRASTVAEENDLSLAGRLVLDIDCTGPMLIADALRSGASWCLGWTDLSSTPKLNDLLLSSGLTRFTLRTFDSEPGCHFMAGMGPAMLARLNEAVVFCDVDKINDQKLARLTTTPWRLLACTSSDRALATDLVRRLETSFELELKFLGSRVQQKTRNERETFVLVRG